MVLKVDRLNIELQKGQTSSILLKNVNFEVNTNEIVVIHGASGCGKSTLLKVIAGFIQIQDDSVSNFKPKSRNWFQVLSTDVVVNGRVFLNDKLLNDLDPRNRKMGYLMQGTKVYPHLNSPKEVLLFPYALNSKLQLKYNKVEFELKAKKLYDFLDMLIPFEGIIQNLSGGEEQRLCLGKIILLEPKVLLLDEPFSSLDFVQREKLRKKVKELVSDKNISINYVIMVSHDIEDCKIADKILYISKNKTQLIMNHGFERAYEVFYRLYGSWEDINERVINQSVISQTLMNSDTREFAIQICEDYFHSLNVQNIDQISNLLLKSYKTDVQLEKVIKSVLDRNKFNEIIISELNFRAEKVSSLVLPHLKGNILDIGCGDCKVSEILQESSSYTIKLADIFQESKFKEIIRKSPNLLFSNYSQIQDNELPYKDKSFDTSLLLTVLHHTRDPGKLLDEAIRVTKSRIIIIESILGIDINNNGDFPYKLDANNEDRITYARVVDWLYNRIVYDEIEVPYNFLSVKDWTSLFKEKGLSICYQEDLGIDVQIAPEHHYIFVLDII